MVSQLRLLLSRAISNVLRGLAAMSKREICCPQIHYAGWR
jgi:hypothetical protein